MSVTAFQIDPNDNVAVLLEDASPGPVRLLGHAENTSVNALESIKLGHKIALGPIAPGQAIIKYGVRIGHAVESIQPGQWVHLHNCASDLDERSNTLDVESGAPTDVVYE